KAVDPCFERRIVGGIYRRPECLMPRRSPFALAFADRCGVAGTKSNDRALCEECAGDRAADALRSAGYENAFTRLT
ncbi:MAG TPA: hypothetical protein VIJ77_08610, partial [Candidatus Tumulicola sp.]